MKRLGTIVLICICAFLSACGSSSSSDVSSLSLAQPFSLKVTWSGGEGYLENGSGARLYLRGVASNALVSYPPWHEEAPSIGESDLKEMAALGINFLRLALSWSSLEPHPGQISDSYVGRIVEVLKWARANGIAVLLDMHEDNYSSQTGPGLESDGAPSWAVVTDGASCEERYLTTTACAINAWNAFFSDQKVAGRGLEEWYSGAVVQLLKRIPSSLVATDVAGLEIMNEPWFGFSPQTALPLGYAFYDKVISAIRRAGFRIPIWFEPPIYRDLTNDFRQGARRFSSDDDLVYAIHNYAGVFSPPFSPDSLSEVNLSYRNAEQEAKIFHAALAADEWGSSAKPAWNSWTLYQIYEQNSLGVPSAFWLFKQRKGPWDDWSLVQINGLPRPLDSAGVRDLAISSARIEASYHVNAIAPGQLYLYASKLWQKPWTLSAARGAWVALRMPVPYRQQKAVIHLDGRAVVLNCRLHNYAVLNARFSSCEALLRLAPGRHVLAFPPASEPL